LDNFGDPMPYIDVNEDFTAGQLDPGTSQHWQTAFTNRRKGSTITVTNATFKDQYEAQVSGGAPPQGMAPAPRNPQSPLGTVRAGTFTHTWFVGSRSAGQGVQVSE